MNNHMRRNEENRMMNKYFNFLCKVVGRSEKYVLLLQRLYSMEFYSLVPNDDNRGVDGTKVRDLFCDEEGPQGLSLCPDGPCTVLEMLIGLSLRLEFETAQSEYEKTPDEWFWILIDNLGLTQFENQLFFDGALFDDVSDIVNIFLERQYTSTGDGGLFPLRKAKKDQREVEIWYQMSAYILENYPI